MQSLLDNDVLKKIADYGLLSAFRMLLAKEQYIRPHGCLAAAPYKLRTRGKKAGLGWSDQRKAAALDTFLRAETRPVTGTAAATIEALNVPYFDVGEVQLLARAIDEPASHIITGDKNAIRALATHASLAAYAAQMNGRVIHFEMIVRRLCSEASFAVVKAAILAEPSTDRGLLHIFSGSTEHDVLAALDASIHRLRGQSGQLLRPRF